MTEALPAEEQFATYGQMPTDLAIQDGYTGQQLLDYVSPSHLNEGERAKSVVNFGRSPLDITSMAGVIVDGLLETILKSDATSGNPTTMKQVLSDHLKQLGGVLDGGSIVPVISSPFTPKFTPLTMLESFNSRAGGDPIQYDPSVIRSFSLDTYNSRLINGTDEDRTLAIGDYALLGVSMKSISRYEDSSRGRANLADYLQAQWLLRKLNLPQIQGRIGLTVMDSMKGYAHIVAESNDWAIKLSLSTDQVEKVLPVSSI